MTQPRFADTVARMHRDPRNANNEFMKGLSQTVDHYLTKRILVNADLWESLYSNPGPAPENRDQLRWPFDDSIYLEPTRPIMPAKMSNTIPQLRQAVVDTGYNPETESSWLRAMLILPTGNTERSVCTVCTWGQEIMANVMKLDLSSGTTRANTGTDSPDLPPNIPGEIHETLPPDWVESGLQYFGRAVTALMTHINRRGVTLEPEPLTRADRRRLEKNNQPNPWYLIRGEQTPEH